MILRIFSGEATDSDKPVYLRLVVSPLGDIVLQVTNSNGRGVAQGNILRFERNGKLYSCPSVNSNLGFNLDERGRIRMEY